MILLSALFPKIKFFGGATLTEGSTGTYTFILDIPAPVNGLTVNFNTLGSTATFGIDYSFSAGSNLTAVTENSFTIAGGATTATLNIAALSDTLKEGNETVSVNLTAGSDYSIINALSFAPKQNYAAGSHPQAVSVGDLNGDGRTDMVVANKDSGSVSVYLRNADNTDFTKQADLKTSLNATFVSVGDFNGDGKSDLVVSDGQSNVISVYLRNATNTGFQAKIDYATGAKPQSVTVGDFNGDGKTDIAVANKDGDTVSVFLRNATNTGFDKQTDLLASEDPNKSAPESITVGDFNGDGKTDIALANKDADRVSVYLRNADNTGFDARSDYAVGSKPDSVSVGDFNNDGKLDMAVANKYGNSVSVLLRNANNTGFDSQFVLDTGAGSSPESVTVGDFNNDGKADIAVANAKSYTVSIYLRNTGNTGFDAKVDYATGLNPRSVTVGDFNNDGKIDLAVANKYGNNVSVLLNTSAPSTALTITHPAPAAADDALSTDEDTAITYTAADLLANDTVAGGYTLTIDRVTKGSGGDVVLNADGTVTFTPDKDFNGAANFSYQVKDGEFISNQATATVDVAAVNDAPTGLPSISGTSTQNQILTATTLGVFDADGLGDFSYQWFANGVKITNATAVTYKLTQADVGKRIVISVSYTDAQGNKESLTSDSTGLVADINMPATGKPTITGTAAQNQVLTAVTTGIKDHDGLVGVTYSYQWQANNVDIEGATTATYTLTQAEVGKTIAVKVSFTDQGATKESVTSAPTATVEEVNEAPTLTSFSGTVISGGLTNEIPLSFVNLINKGDEADVDNNFTAFVVKEVSSGSLKIGISASTAKAFNATSNNTIDASNNAYWTPAANAAAGTVNAFTVVAKDADGLTSATPVQATVKLAGANTAPTLTAFSAAVTTGKLNFENPITFANLTAKGNEQDTDGTVDSFVVKAVSSGSLKIGTSATAATLFSATNNTIDASHNAYWTPSDTATTGVVGAFSVTAQDDGNLQSSTPVVVNVNLSNKNIVPTFTSLSDVVATGSKSGNIPITFASLEKLGNEADTDGSVIGFEVKAVSTGTLKIGTSADSATVWSPDTNDSITATKNAYWTPDATATNGSVVNAFTLVAEDDVFSTSATPVQATVKIEATPPTLTAFNNTSNSNKGDEIQLTFASLKTRGNEADADGTIDSFVVKSVTTGSLKIGTSAATATAFNATSNNTIDATHNAYWTPAVPNSNTTAATPATTGMVLNAFTVVAKDNDDLESATPAQVTVKLTTGNLEPTFTLLNSPVSVGTLTDGAVVSFAKLQTKANAMDVDGVIYSFIVKEVKSGTLKIGSSDFSPSNNTIDASHTAYWTPNKTTATAGSVVDAFTLVAKDDGDLESARPIQAKIELTETNTAPTLTAFTGAAATGIQGRPGSVTVTFANLQSQGDEKDTDGAVDSFIVKAVTSGTLKIGSSLTTATPFSSTLNNLNNLIDAKHIAYWTPATNAGTGNINAFTVVAQDNGNLVSDTAIQATVNLKPAPAPVANLPTPIGKASPNQVLVADTSGIKDLIGSAGFSYQWKAGGVNILGATSESYTLTQAEVGKAITVSVSYFSSTGLKSLVSTPTAAVATVESGIPFAAEFNGSLQIAEIGDFSATITQLGADLIIGDSGKLTGTLELQGYDPAQDNEAPINLNLEANYDPSNISLAATLDETTPWLTPFGLEGTQLKNLSLAMDGTYAPIAFGSVTLAGTLAWADDVTGVTWVGRDTPLGYLSAEAKINSVSVQLTIGDDISLSGEFNGNALLELGNFSATLTQAKIGFAYTSADPAVPGSKGKLAIDTGVKVKLEGYDPRQDGEAPLVLNGGFSTNGAGVKVFSLSLDDSTPWLNPLGLNGAVIKSFSLTYTRTTVAAVGTKPAQTYTATEIQGKMDFVNPEADGLTNFIYQTLGITSLDVLYSTDNQAGATLFKADLANIELVKPAKSTDLSLALNSVRFEYSSTTPPVSTTGVTPTETNKVIGITGQLVMKNYDATRTDEPDFVASALISYAPNSSGEKEVSLIASIDNWANPFGLMGTNLKNLSLKAGMVFKPFKMNVLEITGSLEFVSNATSGALADFMVNTLGINSLEAALLINPATAIASLDGKITTNIELVRSGDFSVVIKQVGVQLSRTVTDANGKTTTTVTKPGEIAAPADATATTAATYAATLYSAIALNGYDPSQDNEPAIGLIGSISAVAGNNNGAVALYVGLDPTNPAPWKNPFGLTGMQINSLSLSVVGKFSPFNVVVKLEGVFEVDKTTPPPEGSMAKFLADIGIDKVGLAIDLNTTNKSLALSAFMAGQVVIIAPDTTKGEELSLTLTDAALALSLSVATSAAAIQVTLSGKALLSGYDSTQNNEPVLAIAAAIWAKASLGTNTSVSIGLDANFKFVDATHANGWENPYGLTGVSIKDIYLSLGVGLAPVPILDRLVAYGSGALGTREVNGITTPNNITLAFVYDKANGDFAFLVDVEQLNSEDLITALIGAWDANDGDRNNDIDKIALGETLKLILPNLQISAVDFDNADQDNNELTGVDPLLKMASKDTVVIDKPGTAEDVVITKGINLGGKFEIGGFSIEAGFALSDAGFGTSFEISAEILGATYSLGVEINFVTETSKASFALKVGDSYDFAFDLDVSEVVSFLSDVVGTVAGWITDNVLGPIADIAGVAFDVVGDAAVAVGAAISDAVEAVGVAVDAAVAAVTNTINDAAAALGINTQAVGDAISGAAASIAKAAENVATAVVTFVSDAAKAISTFVSDVASVVGTVVSDIATTVASFISDVGSAISTAIGGTIDAVVNWVLSDNKDFGSVNDTWTGTSYDDQAKGNGGNDSLYGEYGKDVINGGIGDDKLYGGGGDDIIFAGDGKDSIDGDKRATGLDDQGNDQIDAGSGNDTISGGYGNDLIKGGDGDDTVYGTLNGTVFADTAMDTIDGGRGNDYIDGQDGNDVLAGGDNNDTIYGGDGNDKIDGGLIDDTLYGGNGDDTIVGGGGYSWNGVWTNGHDYLKGDAGNDKMDGGDGNDTLYGGDGDDVLSGGKSNHLETVIDVGTKQTVAVWVTSGDDSLDGEGGNDKLDGGDGNDSLSGGSGSDVLLGGDGNDSLGGGTEQDTLDGGAGNDTLYGSAQTDTISGASSNDMLSGGDGNDVLYGYTGNDKLDGGTGTDLLWGGVENDTLSGGDGNDTLNGGINNDFIDGGAGDDKLYGEDSSDTGSSVKTQIKPTSALAVSSSIVSNNPPSSEGVGNAIDDNVSTKYLNLSELNAGLTVTFSAAQVIDAIKITTANDASERDPASYSVYGSNTSTTTVFTLIAENKSLALSTNRSTESDFYTFNNATAYKYYKIVFPTVRDAATANSMQIADIKFYAPTDHSDTLLGGDGNDYLAGNKGDDKLNGGKGVDTLYGGTGNDTMTGGDNEDKLFGDDGNDALDGGLANDTLDGGTGNDTLIGGAGYSSNNLWISGNDSVDGGVGNDHLDGGDGNDTLIGSDGNDILLGGKASHLETGSDGKQYTITSGNDSLSGGSGLDTLDGSDGNDTLYGGTEDDLLSGGDGVDYLSGDAGNDKLDGGAGNDSLYGGTENDTLLGGLGNDTLSGDTGSDYLFGGDGTDSIDGGLGNDTLDGGADNDTLKGNAGIDLISGGAGNDNIDGGDDADTLMGGDSNDSVSGGRGNDSVSGDAGSDMLDGADGNDTLLGGSENDSLLGGANDDLLDGGTGNDSLDGGTGNDNLSGGNDNDSLTGAAGLDTLNGGLGNDTLSGGDDADMLAGGDGLDYLTGDAGSDKIDGGLGNDTLSGGLNDDTLLGGYGDDSVAGDAGNDTLVGDAIKADGSADGTGNDILNGGVGNDTLLGGNGNDTLLGGSENDNLLGGSGNDSLLGETGNDTLDAGDGDDTLNGGNGGEEDAMLGGLGNDTYFVDNSRDRILENANEGIDTVNSSVTYALTGNIENLVLTGTAAINATGNLLKNILTGNSAANVLTGDLGDDSYFVDVNDTVVENDSAGVDTINASISISTMITYNLAANVENLNLTLTKSANAAWVSVNATGIGNALNNILSITSATGVAAIDLKGLAGNDTYIISDGFTQVVEEVNAGIDTVNSSISYTLTANVENLLLTGSSPINGTGNTSNNTLIGNSGNNSLDGGAGVDTLIGGTGNDMYIVDNSADVVTETSTLVTEIDTVNSSVSYTLGANIENLTLTGTAAINGTGNSLNNLLKGNTANNSLSGAHGNDTLDGGAGIDTLVGGAGNDTYTVDNSADVVTETSIVATEIDTVNSYVSYTLGANVEKLTLTGTTAINGTGNSSNNTLTGNTAANSLSGGTGNDTLIGRAGADTLTGGTGADIFKLTDILSFDSITDFSVVDDTIHLDKAQFSKLLNTGATLTSTEFKIGNAALDSDDYLLYNSSTGVLSYDADGNGAGIAVKIATLGTGLVLTAADFYAV